jgi:SAM-dependent methyltransferase
MKAKNNPWLDIPIEDYEKHMTAPSVMQLQMLDQLFEKVLDEFNPSSICVLGCTAGNGFQRLINRNLERVVGIDINPIYLAECRAWYIEDVPNLELICADLNEFELAKPEFDLIHAALVFEYLDLNPALEKSYRWLKPGGILSVVIQVPSDIPDADSDTSCIPLRRLSTLMNHILPEEFKESAAKIGLIELRSEQVELKKGISFNIGIYERV